MSPGRVLARQHHRLAHRGVRAQRRLDLPGLDAEAAQLDLVVDAAEELEVAVGAAAHQVAGAVEPLAAGSALEGIGDEALRGQVGRGPR